MPPNSINRELLTSWRASGLACLMISTICGQAFCASVPAGKSKKQYEEQKQTEKARFEKRANLQAREWRNQRKEQLRIWQSTHPDMGPMQQEALVESGPESMARALIDFSGDSVRVQAYATHESKDSAHVKVRLEAERALEKGLRQAWEDTLASQVENADSGPNGVDSALSLAERVTGYAAQMKKSLGTALTRITDGKKGHIAELDTLLPLYPGVSKKDSSAPGLFEPNEGHTGIIVDARGLEYDACLAPVFWSDDGKRLYSPAMASSGCALQGLASWVGSPLDARRNSRAGKSPLLLSPKSLKGRHGLVFGESESAQLGISQSLMEQCRVVIVID